MKLKLIKYPVVGSSKDLTIGKYYECEGVCYNDDVYVVRDDAGDHHEVEKVCFEDIEEHPSEWNGEGLPPVGTVCEYQDFNGLWQGPARVFAHHESGGAFVEYIEYIGWDHSPNAERFRPIKSEKDKEIEKITNVWEDAMPLEAFAERLYENGFRFVEN